MKYKFFLHLHYVQWMQIDANLHIFKLWGLNNANDTAPCVIRVFVGLKIWNLRWEMWMCCSVMWGEPGGAGWDRCLSAAQSHADLEERVDCRAQTSGGINTQTQRLIFTSCLSTWLQQQSEEGVYEQCWLPTRAEEEMFIILLTYGGEGKKKRENWSLRWVPRCVPLHASLRLKYSKVSWLN